MSWLQLLGIQVLLAPLGTCIATWLGRDWQEMVKLTSLLWLARACSGINIGEIFTQTLKVAVNNTGLLGPVDTHPIQHSPWNVI